MTILQPNLWVDLYADYLYSFAMMRTKDDAVTKDLIQDTFYSAIQNKDNFKGNSSEKTWLSAILKNKIYDYYRKNQNKISYNEYIEKIESGFESSHYDSSNVFRWKEMIVPNYFSEDESVAASEEFLNQMETCLNKLPDKIRKIFISKYVDEVDTKVICKDFALSSSNYWIIIYRAKVMIRECLEKKIVR